MARHLSVASVIETHNIASEVAYIILIECDIMHDNTILETIRICNNTENITYQGTEYIAASFSMDVKQQSGEEPSVRFASHDPTGILRQRIEELNGGVGSPVRMKVVNTADLDAPAEITEEFIITGASAQGYGVTLTLGAENPLRMRFPLRVMFRNRCSFKYKGARCKYAGAMGSCDYTFDGANGCQAHGNEENFGGFRGLKNLNV